MAQRKVAAPYKKIAQLINQIPREYGCSIPLAWLHRPEPPSASLLYTYQYTPHLSGERTWAPSLSELIERVPEAEPLDNFVIMQNPRGVGFHLAKRTRIISPDASKYIARFKRDIKRYEAEMLKKDKYYRKLCAWATLIRDNLPEAIRVAPNMSTYTYARYVESSRFKDVQIFHRILCYTFDVPREKLREECLITPGEEEAGEITFYRELYHAL